MISLNDVLLAMSNIPVDDPIAEIWGRGLQGGYKAVEYTDSLPITINANGDALLDYRIYGNTVQDGTPTPENPVDVVSCGVRTENLINVFATDTTNGFVNNAFLLSSGNLYTPSKSFVSEYFPISENTVYTYFTGGKTGDTQSLCFYGDNKGYISGVAFGNVPIVTFTTPTNARYIRTTVMRVAADQESYRKAMLVLGDTVPDYFIPYGYKLPILSNSTVTNIYLGEAETTRRIKKLVLTGEETWWKSQSTNTFYIQNAPGISLTNKNLTMCSHFEYAGQTKGAYGTYYTPPTSVQQFNFVWNKSATAEEWKAYLAAQYAAGTPVTIWYVLAKPKTAVVNEPLMKIGDYADALSMEQAGVSIPTFAGTTVIDYDGDPKPSQMYIKYKGKR